MSAGTVTPTGLFGRVLHCRGHDQFRRGCGQHEVPVDVVPHPPFSEIGHLGYRLPRFFPPPKTRRSPPAPSAYPHHGTLARNCVRSKLPSMMSLDAGVVAATAAA